MQYNSSMYKRHYGKLYINNIIITGIMLPILILLIFCRIEMIVNMVQVLFVADLLVGFPLSLAFYVSRKRQSKLQRQWFYNGKLYLERILEKGHYFFIPTNRKVSVTFDHISSVTAEQRYIVVTGRMHVVDNNNGRVSERDVSEYKIPRNFENEERILNYGGMKPYGS